ncbi:MAG: AEC family transporter [Bdellovibrionota bacterium]
MSNFIIIVVCLLLGFALRRVGRFERSRVRPLNFVILWISLPALVLSELPKVFASSQALSTELVCLALMPWLVFAFTFAVAFACGRWLGWSRATVGAVTLTAGLGNTSFVGYPLIEMFYGREALSLAIVVDQPGTFLALSTVGIMVASFYSARAISIGEAVKRMLTFPPLIAVVIAVLLATFDVPREGLVQSALALFGRTLVPFALISVGWQLELDRALIVPRWHQLVVALGLKLVVSPLLAYVIFSRILERSSLAFQVVVLEAAMAPMITAAVVAREMELDGDLAQLLVGLGIPLSFLTVSLWWWVLA